MATPQSTDTPEREVAKTRGRWRTIWPGVIAGIVIAMPFQVVATRLEDRELGEPQPVIRWAGLVLGVGVGALVAHHRWSLRTRKAASSAAWRLFGIVLTCIGFVVIGYCSVYLVKHFISGWNPEGNDFKNTTVTLWLALLVFGVGPVAYGLNMVFSGTRTGEPPPVEASTRLIRTLAPGGSHSVAVTPDGACALGGGPEGQTTVWDLATGCPLRTLDEQAMVFAVAVAPDGQSVVSGSHDRTVRVWDLASGRLVHTLKGHKKPVRSVVVSPDGRWAVSGSEDWTLRVWDLASGEAVSTMPGKRFVGGVAVSPDGRLVLAGHTDRTVRVLELASGATVQTLKGHAKAVWALAVTPDGRRVVSGSSDKTVRVWDLTSGRPLQTMEGHTKKVSAVAVTPDGRRVVSGSSDKTVRVWDLTSGSVLHTLVGHRAAVHAVAVTPDGRFAVSGSSDGTVLVWDIAD